tara:strand:+ start:761 stop:1465 length:705 start_codon:yes stop_codon:yes gene_type:complete
MSTFTVEQIEVAMNAPVEHPTGPRASKVIATARISSPVNAANAAKQRKRRIAAEKKEAIKQRKLERAAKKAQKVKLLWLHSLLPMTAIAKQAAKQSTVRRKSIREAKKSHATFKKTLKATRSQLNLKWKEAVKVAKAAKKAEKAVEDAKKKAAKASKKAAREEAIVVKKAAKVTKSPTPKKATLTDEQKQQNKAKRAYQTEMNRRSKWYGEFQTKFGCIPYLPLFYTGTIEDVC